MSAPQEFLLDFEPDGKYFFDEPDGSLYSVHAEHPVSVNDGQFIIFKEAGNSSVSVNLKAAQHGTHGGNPASLLLFEFKFSHSGRKCRIKRAFIDIEFKYSETPAPPHIYSFCPCHVLGDEVKSTITTQHTAGLSVGCSQPSLGVNASTSTTKVLEQSNRFTLTSANTKTHSGGRIVNGVRWALTENESSEAGIPYFVPIALLVKRNSTRNLKATISVEMTMSPGLNLKSWFGMRIKALALPIDVGKGIGQQLEKSDFDAVDLATLVDLPSYV